ncbi:MAG: response regulator [Oscillospiraceae bacterium]|jgi:two-component system response regulator (stage 0 sporulation protein A)|nr:response regulator [Oscillospiraceae bacterium]
MDGVTRVWIAESDPAQGRYLADMLRMSGQFDVVGVSPSGQEALEAVETTQIDVLLLALALRDMDGLAVLEKVGKSSLISYPRIAVITAMAGTHSEQAKALGADVIFPKPVDEARLVAWLSESLKNSPNVAQSGMEQRRMVAKKALEYLDMSPDLIGCQYLVEAIAIASMDHMVTRRMMSELYPKLAAMFDTSVSCVERSIRHAIEETWTSGRLSAAVSLFGYSVDPKRGKPTNSECIARLGEYVRFLLSGEDARVMTIN